MVTAGAPSVTAVKTCSGFYIWFIGYKGRPYVRTGKWQIRQMFGIFHAPLLIGNYCYLNLKLIDAIYKSTTSLVK